MAENHSSDLLHTALLSNRLPFIYSRWSRNVIGCFLGKDRRRPLLMFLLFQLSEASAREYIFLLLKMTCPKMEIINTVIDTIQWQQMAGCRFHPSWPISAIPEILSLSERQQTINIDSFKLSFQPLIIFRARCSLAWRFLPLPLSMGSQPLSVF